MLTERISAIYYLITRGYIPGVLVVVYRRKGKTFQFLLVKSKVSNAVTFPSGGLMIGEEETKSTSRELLEEAGIRAKDLIELPIQHKFVYRLPIKLKSVQKIFLTEVEKSFKQEKPEKSTGWVKWFSSEEVKKKLTHKELRQTFDLVMKHIKKKKYESGQTRKINYRS